MEAKYLLLTCFLVFLAGCPSQTQTQFVCADGTTVADPSACPPGAISPQTGSSTQTFVCADGTTVGNPEDCPHCPSSCDDGNPCTEDICGLDTSFSCQHISQEGPQPNCEGTLTGCLQSTCSAGRCTSEPKVPCCGNGKCEQGETCSSCAADCSCQQGDLCCENICRAAECSSDYECNDQNELTADKCSGTGCGAKCVHTAISSCKDGDGGCPEGCSAYTDSDCPTYQVRQYGNVTDELRASVLSKATRHCFGEGKDEGDDYGYFLVLTVNFENSALDDKMVATDNFKIVAKSGEEFFPVDTVPGDCDTSGMFASNVVEVLAWKNTEGEVWFELGQKDIRCDFIAILDRSVYNEQGELVWNVPC